VRAAKYNKTLLQLIKTAQKNNLYKHGDVSAQSLKDSSAVWQVIPAAPPDQEWIISSCWETVELKTLS